MGVVAKTSCLAFRVSRQDLLKIMRFCNSPCVSSTHVAGFHFGRRMCSRAPGSTGTLARANTTVCVEPQATRTQCVPYTHFAVFHFGRRVCSCVAPVSTLSRLTQARVSVPPEDLMRFCNTPSARSARSCLTASKHPQGCTAYGRDAKKRPRSCGELRKVMRTAVSPTVIYHIGTIAFRK